MKFRSSKTHFAIPLSNGSNLVSLRNKEITHQSFEAIELRNLPKPYFLKLFVRNETNNGVPKYRGKEIIDESCMEAEFLSHVTQTSVTFKSGISQINYAR